MSASIPPFYTTPPGGVTPTPRGRACSAWPSFSGAAKEATARHAAKARRTGLPATCSQAMAQVELTQHLKNLFPQLAKAPLSVEAISLAAVIRELERLAPGVAFYICDERGRLRRHVNIFVDNELLIDRNTLSDPLRESSRVFIAQALSGGR